jgi:hypothetical protein
MFLWFVTSAFATSSVDEPRLRETGRELQMYSSASQRLWFDCGDCSGLASIVRSRKLGQCPRTATKQRFMIEAWPSFIAERPVPGPRPWRSAWAFLNPNLTFRKCKFDGARKLRTYIVSNRPFDFAFAVLPRETVGARRVGAAATSRNPENNMLIHLPIIILTSLHPTPIADAVPKFDIARECQGEGGNKEIQKRCADDETQARGQLQTEWTQFTPSARSQCIQETSMDGTPSYVEFLTCLEMERDVRIEREARKTSK